jgi:hypothetical protein
VAMEVAKFNDIASADMQHGSRVLDVGDAKRVLVVMTKPTQIESVLELGRLRGLRVGELFPSASAAFSAVAGYSAAQSGTTAVIDVGHGGTCVSFGGASGMLFARPFRTGGEAFTEALREGYGLSGSQADTFKVTKGALDSDDAQMAERLGKVAELWCSEVSSCIAGFSGHYPDPSLAVERVVLCGGASLLPGLSEALAAKLGVPIVPLSTATEGALTDRQAGMAGAVGLAKATLKRHAVVSLLPEYIRDELVFRKKKPLWISTGVILALALGVFSLSVVRAIKQEGDRLRAMKGAVKERRMLVNRISQMEGLIGAYQACTGPVMSLLTWGPRVRGLVTVTAESLDHEDWVSLICDTESYEAVPLFDETPEERPRPTRSGGMRDRRLLTAAAKRAAVLPTDAPKPLPQHFVVEGYTHALDLASVKDLVLKLQARGDVVETADLRFDDMVQPADWFRRYMAGDEYKRFALGVTLRGHE